MNGQWNDKTGMWEDQPVALPTASNSQTLETPTPSVPQQEPTIEEHASMLRQGFERLVNKAVEGTELARRVAAQQNAIETLQKELRAVQDDLSLERLNHAGTREKHQRVFEQLVNKASDLATEERNHEDTQKRLQEAQSELARRESTVHDLVMERDIAIGERNAAQAERDDARAESRFRQENIDFLTTRLEDTAHENAVLRERSEMMERKVGALRSAFAALSEGEVSGG